MRINAIKTGVSCLLLAGCAASEAYPPPGAYWDQPVTGWYWVADGVEPAGIVEAARTCGAHVDGSVADHQIVPPGFAVHVFRFVGENTPSVRACTVERLSAVPQLTTYLRGDH